MKVRRSLSRLSMLLLVLENYQGKIVRMDQPASLAETLEM